MSRPDDLKIDISELFGGDVSDAKEAVERQEQVLAQSGTEAGSPDQGLVQAEAEKERRYQEMLRLREHEMAQQSHLFEKKLQTQAWAQPIEASEELTEDPIPEPAPVLQVTQTDLDPVPDLAAETSLGVTEPAGGEARAETTLEVIEPAVGETVSEPMPEAPTPTEPAAIDFDQFDRKPFAPFPGAPGSVPAPPPLTRPQAPPVLLDPIGPPGPLPIQTHRVDVPKPNAAPEAPVPSAHPEAPAPEGPSPEELARIQKEHDYLLLYDQFRNIILHELTDLVGDKKAKTMLSRTVETARNKYPEVFRNANWDAAGNLIEDGSMDSQRLIHNKTLLDPTRADAVQDAGLGALLEMRLLAVEKGLGAGMRSKIRGRIQSWLTERRDKAVAAGQDPRPIERLRALVA